MYISLDGIWKAVLADGTEAEAALPGTLDESGLGHKDSGTKQWHPDQSLGSQGQDISADAPIATRFTRKHTYEGAVKFTRSFTFSLPRDKRIFLEAERARVLRLFVDGREVMPWEPASISTPYVFEVTGMLDGTHEVTLLSDNSYPGLPRESILYSSAATDETQTNWNGVIGYLRLRAEERVFLASVAVYPIGKELTVRVEISAQEAWEGFLDIKSEALRQSVTVAVEAAPGKQELVLSELPLADGLKLWDEEEGNLYALTAVLRCGKGEENCAAGSGRGERAEERAVDEKTVAFGIRTFGDNGKGRLALNGRTLFLRSEANCGEFPETGHAPMTVEEWEEILKRYRAYGVNCVRFHSHCPPRAAFMAADKLGMMMQPELSNWNPKDAFASEESRNYYRTELETVIRMLANHPSFVMLTLGNELHADEAGHKWMDELLRLARAMDPTRLYANGSNVHYGEIGCDSESDFYTSQSCRKAVIRGTSSGMQGYMNRQYPCAKVNYDKDMELIRQEYAKPVFSFEVGQYEVLPDFQEIPMFRGISEPVNLQLIREKVEAQGLMEEWGRYVEASGELARIGYREEIEAAMRTKELSGISLLGLQDFPGQGTALVGMMNAHLQPKPYAFARPERFRAFFRESLPLVLLEKYTYEAGEVLRADILVANFGKEAITGELAYELKAVRKGKHQDGTAYQAEGKEQKEEACGAAGKEWKEESHGAARKENKEEAGRAAGKEWEEEAGRAAGKEWEEEAGRAAGKKQEAEKQGVLGSIRCPAGTHTNAGTLEIHLGFVEEPTQFLLTVRAGEIENTYPVWVYPPVHPICPECVYETMVLDERAEEVLRQGGSVYLAPKSDKEHLPDSIQGQFTTDFWSVGTFPDQEGGMGQLIDAAHPLFDHFPTDTHTDWQWWIMASQRAVILPRPMKGIVTEMDSYAYLRPMAQLMEFRCGGGKVLFSSMGLQDLQQYPEARALLHAIYTYLDSDAFVPEQELSPEEVRRLCRGHLCGQGQTG